MFTDEGTEGQRDERQTQLGLAPEGRPGLKPVCPGSHSSILCATHSQKEESPRSRGGDELALPPNPFRLLLGPHPPRVADWPAHGPEHTRVQRPVALPLAEGVGEGRRSERNRGHDRSPLRSSEGFQLNLSPDL